MSQPALDLLGQAQAGLAEAAQLRPAGERYARAHLAALRGAAAVLAARAHPDTHSGTGAVRRRRLRSAWDLLCEVAPEMGEWAAFFAAGAAKRAAAEAGVSRAVTDREADDLVRDVETFLAVVATTVGSREGAEGG
ncbi:MAG: SAV_6107 family HEPN domain-containing protein [Geodermatophilaceae bacterium]